MALATATGQAWQTMSQDLAAIKPFSLQCVALVGARDIDPGEKYILQANGIPVTVDANEIRVRLADCTQTYVHLDMDVHDALEVRVNRFAVPDGLSIEAVRNILVSVERLAVLAVTGLDPSVPDAKKALEVAIDHVCAVAEAWKDGQYDA
jgi:arginase family enzyme